MLLAEREPLRPVAVKRRRILMTEEVATVFDSNAHGFPRGGDVVVHNFVSGSVVNISRKQAKRKSSAPDIHLEKLEGHDEIWALCVRRPKPGWRFFGRFIAMDSLALFTAYDKAERGQNYESECERVRTLWKQEFGNAVPHFGIDVSDYISGPYYDVDTASDY